MIQSKIYKYITEDAEKSIMQSKQHLLAIKYARKELKKLGLKVTVSISSKAERKFKKLISDRIITKSS